MFKLTAITVALALSQNSANTIRSRELSEEKFISYEPQTTVTDHVREINLKNYHIYFIGMFDV